VRYSQQTAVNLDQVQHSARGPPVRSMVQTLRPILDFFPSALLGLALRRRPSRMLCLMPAPPHLQTPPWRFSNQS
jgi:hypothetical protein